jgi:hypothetical protein
MDYRQTMIDQARFTLTEMNDAVMLTAIKARFPRARDILRGNVMKNQKSTATKDLSPEDRYDQDPQFKALVDILGALIRQARVTPIELREAVKLAASRSSK